MFQLNQINMSSAKCACFIVEFCFDPNLLWYELDVADNVVLIMAVTLVCDIDFDYTVESTGLIDSNINHDYPRRSLKNKRSVCVLKLNGRNESFWSLRRVCIHANFKADESVITILHFCDLSISAKNTSIILLYVKFGTQV